MSRGTPIPLPGVGWSRLPGAAPQTPGGLPTLPPVRRVEGFSSLGLRPRPPEGLRPSNPRKGLRPLHPRSRLKGARPQTPDRLKVPQHRAFQGREELREKRPRCEAEDGGWGRGELREKRARSAAVNGVGGAGNCATSHARCEAESRLGVTTRGRWPTRAGGGGARSVARAGGAEGGPGGIVRLGCQQSCCRSQLGRPAVESGKPRQARSPSGTLPAPVPVMHFTA